MAIAIAAEVVSEVLGLARAEAPRECCAVLGGRGGVVRTVYPLRNVAATPETRYGAAPEDLFHATRAMRAAGEELLGIFHSHPGSPAYPSPTDVQLAFYPQAVYFIVSLAGSEPVLNAFHICDGEVTAVEYRVIPGE